MSARMAAATAGLSSRYVTPYQRSGEESTSTVQRPARSSAPTSMGMYISAFSGLRGSSCARNCGKRASSTGKIAGVKPHMFMETRLSAGRGVHVSPSSVKAGAPARIYTRVRSTTLTSRPFASVSHTPRATEPCSVSVFIRRKPTMLKSYRPSSSRLRHSRSYSSEKAWLP